jgi:DNA-binding LacI/PurR family transcriptional regulator
MVCVDNAVGIGAAMDHLLDLDHRQIAFVSGRPLGDIEERRAAYEARMRAEGLDIPDGFVRQVANEPAGGALALAALMDLPLRPTAIVCSTDQLAIGVLHGASSLDVAVPGDVSVVGFDDLPVSAFTVPSLTTIRMPVHEMAARAIQMAIESRARGGSPTVEVLRPELIIRQSTAVAPTEAMPSVAVAPATMARAATEARGTRS